MAITIKIFSQKNLIIILIVSIILISVLQTPAFAHQNGCHRWHSCPSDHGTYECGDMGYCSQCPDNNYCKAGQSISSSSTPSSSTPSSSTPSSSTPSSSTPSSSTPSSSTPSSSTSQTISIPSWIKNNAKWWSQGQIGDSDMMKGLQYLISNGIIVIPSTTISGSSSQQIPSWIKNNAKWWSEGSIDDSEFIKGIQYLVQAGIIHVNSSTQKSTSQTNQQTSSNAPIASTPLASNQIVFAPCPEVNIAIPSSCLGNYLPTPSNLGSGWISQDGQSIPLGVTPSPMITQYVHQDYENIHTNPEEVFDVWIEEWQSNDSAYTAFKSDENSASKEVKFVGNPESNDISFAYIDQGNSYHTEFVIGTVIAKIDGIGGSQTAINDMGIIAKLIMNKL